MNIKETLEHLTKFTEDTEQNPDIRLRALKLKNKAEELGLECTSISGGFDTNPMIMLNIYFPNDKKAFYVYIYSNKPTEFQYENIKLTQDAFIHYVEKINKMVEIVKAL
jgi:hypothetical protein